MFFSPDTMIDRRLTIWKDIKVHNQSRRHLEDVRMNRYIETHHRHCYKLSDRKQYHNAVSNVVDDPQNPRRERDPAGTLPIWSSE
jgi:hypothetical protein